MVDIPESEQRRLKYFLDHEPELRSISLEAGHVYADEDLSSPELAAGARLGAELRDFLIECGRRVKPIVLVDDFHADRSQFDLARYQELLMSAGYRPEAVVFEADLAAQADQKFQELEARDLVIKDGRGHLILKGRRVLLRDRLGRVSCQLLDACLYLRRLEEADAAVTVLPTHHRLLTYHEQQRDTRNLLRVLTGRQWLPIITVLFRLNPGEISIGIPEIRKRFERRVRE